MVGIQKLFLDTHSVVIQILFSVNRSEESLEARVNLASQIFLYVYLC